MPAATKLSAAAASAMADAIGDLADAGFVRIYAGTVPANADAALDRTNHLLAQLTLSADAFPAAVNGVLNANAITQDSDAAATGTAAFFRVTKADGTVLWQGTCGTAAADMVMPTTAIAQHAAVQAVSLAYTVQKG